MVFQPDFTPIPGTDASRAFSAEMDALWKRHEEANKAARIVSERERAAELAKWVPLPTSLNIQHALSKMEQLIEQGIGRRIREHQWGESDYLRTAETPEALKEMDSSEFMNRYLKKLGIFSKTPNFSQEDFKNPDLEGKFENKLRKVGTGKFLPQAGDIYTDYGFYKTNGVVKSYDKTTDTMVSLECEFGRAGGWLGEISVKTSTDVTYTAYGPTRTYYRPVETPSVTPPSSTKTYPVKKVEPITTTPSVTVPGPNNKVVPSVIKPDLVPSNSIGTTPKVETGSVNSTLGKTFAPTVPIMPTDKFALNLTALSNGSSLGNSVTGLKHIDSTKNNVNTPINTSPVESSKAPYLITVRAFHPSKEFGGNFKGDNRGYTTESTTARITQVLSFDADKSVLPATAWSSKSHHPVFGEDRAIPKQVLTFSKSATEGGQVSQYTIRASVAAANPLPPPGTPDINIFSALNITENKKGNTLSINGKLTGDNFPSTEAFITDPSGKSAFLGIGFCEGNPFTSLPGENKDRPIMNFSIMFNRDKDGNFTEVNSNGKVYTINNWNKQFEKTDPAKKDK